MSRTASSLAVLAVLTLGVLVGGRFARAEDPHGGNPHGGRPAAPQPVTQPFVEALVGAWNVETAGPYGGKGKVTFAKGVGGTALVEDYEKTSAMGTYYAHGVYRVSDDGKTITLWRFDNHGVAPMTLSGPLGENGYTVTGEVPSMGSVKLTCEKKGDALVHTFSGSGLEITSTYTKAK